MTVGLVRIPVTDLEAATTLYRGLLGTDPYVQGPWYVGFRPATGPEIGLDPNGSASGLTGPLVYVKAADITAAVAGLQSAGASIRQPVTDVGGGQLTAILADPDGNPLGVMQA